MKSSMALSTPRRSPVASRSSSRPQEFQPLPLRVHNFLAGVPLHDVWVVDLPNFAVYMLNVSRFTPVYMAVIDTFRKLVV
jgi:hypothetical protein